MKLKADFHVHTHYSVDGYMPPEDLLKRARELGLDVIGVADHGTCKGALKVRELSCGRPLVLAGQEVKTREGEILVFGIDKDLPEERPLRETCRTAREMGGFIIAPHPFDRFRYGIGKSLQSVIEYVDAIEGFNSKCIFSAFNRQAREFALKNGKPLVSGSDAHFASDMGSGITLLECRRTEESVLGAIRKGRTEISGNRTSVTRNVVTRLRKTLKNNKKAPAKL